MVADKGNLEIAELLLQNKADVNAKNSYRFTPLHYASKSGHLEVVKLYNGADVNTKGSAGNTPLHLAATSGYPKVVETLLKHGARQDLRDDVGRTPLQDAEYFQIGDYQKVIALLQNK